jgi:hypothetical protein
MKKIIFYVFSLAVSLVTISCEDSVNITVPVSEHKEQYVLNCVINASSFDQYVTITKTYNMDGTTNVSDPFVSNAKVNLVYKGYAFQFTEKQMPREDTAKYGQVRNYYSVSTLTFKPGDSLSIDATLPNGIVLNSSIRLPLKPSITKNFTVINTSRTTASGSSIGFYWSEDANKTNMFSPRLFINYQKFENGVLADKVYQIEAPAHYLKNGTEYTAYYHPLMKHYSAIYDFEAIDSAIEKICSVYEQRQNYKIINATFKLLVINETLAAYYASTNAYADNVTVKLDEGEYSNIFNGLGIFGGFITVDNTIYFEREYLNQKNFYVDPI